MNEVRDRTFADQAQVDTDGNHYIACKFDSAVLRYGGGPLPAFENCTFGDIGWYFHDSALRTIQLLQQINNGGGAPFITELFAPGNFIGE